MVEDKENNDLMQMYNIPQNIMSQQFKKSSSQADINVSGSQDYSIDGAFTQEQYDANSQSDQSYSQNVNQPHDQYQMYEQMTQNQSQITKKKVTNKRSQSKDVKILQTMKAYFPQIAPPDKKKTGALIQQLSNPLLQKAYGVQRQTTQSQGKGQHSERIIFVENRRKPVPSSQIQSTIDYKGLQRSVDRKDTQGSSNNIAYNQSVTASTKNSEQIRKNTQLPPINRKQQVQVLDQSQPNSNISPRTQMSTKILSPASTNQQLYQEALVFGQDNYQLESQSQLALRQLSGKKRKSSKFNYTSASDNNPAKDVFMVNGIILEGIQGDYDLEQQRLNQQRIDYERKNQEMIQKMQEKKNQEMKIIEEERRKLQKRQQKLKNMILKEAAEIRERKAKQEEEAKRKQQEEADKEKKKTPKKIKPYIPQPKLQKIEIEAEDIVNDLPVEEEKQKMDMLKKYYRSRYATFLKTIQEKNKKREEELEVIRRKEEKKKARLQEELGIKQVQSRFMDEVSKISKEANDKVVIEELPRKKQQDQPQRRGSSISNVKSLTSTSNFNQTNTSTTQSDSMQEIQKIYVKDSKRNRSSSNSQKRALTPKVKKSKRVIVMPIDEKTEEDFEKEQKARKEAAEKIKMRQQKYLQDLQDKKEKDQVKAEEERKKKEQMLKQAREQAKQNFDKVQNQPGLKEMQEKQQDQKNSASDDEDQESEAKKKKKKSKKTDAGQLESFLERNNPKKVIFPNITDMATWKKKYKVDDSVKVFICTGGYPDIKRALKKRGWVENKDCTSPCFDLKWVLKSKDIDHNTLNDHQLVNHFNKATAITTKVGLCHNLKNLIWFNNVDIDTFYPRCFDLAMQEDLDDFIEEFKAVKAESYVKQFVREMRESLGEKPSQVTDKILKVALKVCEKRLRELDELIDDPNAFTSLVTEEEWAILGADELNTESLAKQKHENWLAKNEVMQNEKKKQDKKAKEAEKLKKKKKKKMKKIPNDLGNQNGEGDEDYEKDGDFEGWDTENKRIDADEAEEDLIDDDDQDQAKVDQDIDIKIMNKHPEYKRAVKVLEDLKEKYPQFNLNGENNIWIIKPAGSSRGRGIVLYKQLVEILDLCKQKESQYIAQKYIENSLIVKNRKFDIRQWVLVTDWNPLTVWVYQEPYFRFPASDYNPNNILDRFIHLTNNSVAKYAEKAVVTHEIEGNMWCFEEMRNYLQEEYGWDVWEDKLKEQTQNIIINCLESVQDMFECKPGCFELFGFDLMIDEDFNMWLIEVNSSPAMDYSTSVTERLVKLVLEDTVKVVVDYAQAKKKSKVDTGLFECIYKASKIVDKPINSFGLNLVCEGKKMAPNRVAQQAVLLVSLGLALITVSLLAAGYPDCQTANLYFAMGMIFFIYAVIFLMMLLQFIGLVTCLKTIPRAIMGFYFILVAVMFYVQMVLFKGDNCYQDSPVLFVWLVSQIGLFYLVIAIGLAKWGSYICWQAESHDQLAKRAVEDYIRKMKNKNQLMIDNRDDHKKPLLDSDDEKEHRFSDESQSSDEESRRKQKKKSKKQKIQQTGVLAIEN